MTLLEKYSKSSKDNAKKILDGAVPKLEKMEATFAQCFPYPSLSAASADFKANSVESGANEKVSNVVAVTMDEISALSQDARALELYLNMHIPKMEDGNNFGVTVQLNALKELKEMQEAAGKALDDLSGYANARAESLSKLNLPSTSSSVTQSTSTTTTDGKKEEKSSQTTEEKQSSSPTSGPMFDSRVAALIATDTLYYSKAQRAFLAVMAAYMASYVFRLNRDPVMLLLLFSPLRLPLGLLRLDYMDKNKEKLEKPKGSGGSHSGFHSMY
eukprot:scaffold15472_cov117-Cylindrotheca_fusiformis.AAC.3